MQKGLERDVGAYATAVRMGSGTAVAGGAGDATLATTAWIDRAPAERGPYKSGKLVIAYTTTLAAAATLGFTVTLKDATTVGGAGAAAYGTAKAAGAVATGPGGGGTVTGCVELDFNFETAREFLAADITPDLSAGSVDTAAWTAIMVFFGSDRNPISARVN
jgi:hypothetical protein